MGRFPLQRAATKSISRNFTSAQGSFIASTRGRASANSIISYAVVEYGYTPTTAPSTEKGGCIYSNSVPLTVSHSRLSFGDAWWGGAGIYGYNVNGLTITHCLIADNWANLWRGGGIFLENCTNANVSYNVITRNKADGG